MVKSIFSALLWKNFLLKRRHPIATAFEILLPIAFIVLFGGLRPTLPDIALPVGWSDTTESNASDTIGSSFNLFASSTVTLLGAAISIPKFAFTESTMSGLMMSMNLKSLEESSLTELSATDQQICAARFLYQGFVSTDPDSEFAVPAECGGQVIPFKLAIAPDTAFSRAYFFQKVQSWHERTSLVAPPQNGTSIFTISSLNDSVVFFDSAAALEDYVSGSEYATDLAHPKIYAGVVFNRFPTEQQLGTFTDVDYSIRLNATQSTRRGTGDVTNTNGNPTAVDEREKGIRRTEYFTYSLYGFMTLQTLVARFVNCMPVWDPVSGQPGACSTANSVSTENDDRYYQQYQQDLLLTAAIKTFNSVSPLQVSLDSVPAASRERLLVPLRQAPQPVLGQLVYPMPIEAFTSSPFFDAVQDYFPLVFMLSYLYSVSRVLTVLVLEKETKVRELLKIMGVAEQSIISSWYATYIVIGLIASVLQTLAAKVGLFTNSNVLLIFLYFFLFSLDVLAFGYMVSAFFSKAKTGAFFGMVLFFMFFFASYGFSSTTAEGVKNAGSLLAPVALAFGAQSFASVEVSGIGVTFSNFTQVFDNYRFITALVFMAIDFVLYTLLGIYFEKVVPQEYGTTLPWNFLFTRKYWSHTTAVSHHAHDDKEGSHAQDENVYSIPVSVDQDHIEPVSAELRQQEQLGQACVLRNLRKVFPVPGGEMVAVKSLDLAMYQGQITCLLGHNGAGKTTTISMLTGMLAPTSGDATINGYSLIRDIAEIRKSLGMCPQHDVLYPELTVREHLLFFARVKGFENQELIDAVDNKIVQVGLTEKVNTPTTELSGGMKRKLSVAIALIGDSKLVMLDEPTSGMDPYSRRSTWELLQNNRHGRVMVLTTHFMDEADLLGDRIAIMSQGQLRCCGSSLFLKNRYGAGYNLTMVKQETCVIESVVDFMKSHVLNASVLSNVGAEISFQLPLEASGSFPEMFRQLDASMDSLGIAQYGISVTTMEEVFIKVAEEGDLQQQQSLRDLTKELSVQKLHEDTYRLDAAAIPSRREMFGIHLRALWIKRLNYARRDKRSVVFSMFMPLLLLFLGLLILKLSALTSNQPSLVLDTSLYSATADSPTPFACNGATDNTCSTTMNSLFTGAAPSEVSPIEPYSSTTPTVFDVEYTDPSIDPIGSTGVSLRFGEEVFESRAQGQFGAYVIESNASGPFGYNVLVNTTSIHAAPIFKSLMDQSIYRYMANGPNLAFTVNSHPLPLTAATKALFSSFLSFSAVLFIAIAFAFYPAAIVVFIVKEKENGHNAKHQQLVSGVSLPAFWLANFLWDLLVYAVLFGASLALIQAFNITSLTGRGSCTTNCTSDPFAAVVLLFALFGLAVIPFTYVFSYIFKQHAAAQNLTLMINFVLGVVLLVVSFVLDAIESTVDANKVLKFFWRLSPLFSLGNSLLNLSVQDIRSNFGRTTAVVSAFDLDICGWEMLYLGLEIFIFSSMAIGFDILLSYPSIRARFSRDPIDGSSSTSTTSSIVDEDSDVVAERERVQTTSRLDDLIQIKGLRKVYKGGKVAVRDISFGLTKGECFGFLGINGAGKTSTLKMLTGDILPTAGSATLAGYDIMSQQMEIRRLIGYCPQFDALLDLLTVREHLELYGRIKGIPAVHLESVVREKLDQMQLIDYETKLAGSLSGGNKRKLSVAIAMIGSPPILFLDEPSTGMDPVARRFMWEVIANISTERRESTIILTTHSMEECEALCTKVGIMVGGRLRCLGSIQHLKGKFGDGLMVDIKLTQPTDTEIADLMQQAGLNTLDHIDSSALSKVCSDLGHPERFNWICHEHGTGWLIQAALDRDGNVSASEFGEWWLGESYFKSLLAYMENGTSFSSVQVIERRNDQCRFKLLQHADQTRASLSDVFGLIEAEKQHLHIKEYSVSQTSLEQIFNQFAAQQDEEKGVARGQLQAPATTSAGATPLMDTDISNTEFHALTSP